MDNKPRFHISVDTAAIRDRLRKVKDGETVTYGELSVILGRNIQNSARSVLQSARHILESQDRVLFATISKVGLRRMTEVEAASDWRKSIDRIGRESKRGERRSRAVTNPDVLPAAARSDFFLGQAVLPVMTHFTKDKSLKLVEAKITNAPLPLQKTLDAFRGDTK